MKILKKEQLVERKANMSRKERCDQIGRKEKGHCQHNNQTLQMNLLCHQVSQRSLLIVSFNPYC